MKPVITLISDWRLRDPYVAMFKGELLSIIPDATLIDITHHVNFRDQAQTAFLMHQTYLSFPEGTIHLMLTEVLFSSVFNPVVVERNGHFFIGEDNGVLSLMLASEGNLEGRRYVGDEHRALTKMVLLAKYIADNVLNEHTEASGPLVSMFSTKAYNNVFERKIEGKVVYIDAYFNAITNIPIQMFRACVPGNEVRAEVSSKSMWKISSCDHKYDRGNELFFIENSIGCMEIAIAQGKVAALTGLSVGDDVTVFY